MNKEIDNLLLESGVGIDNALNNKKIGDYLNPYGYTLERLNEGKLKHTQATNLHQQQIKEYGDQTEATDQLKQARATASLSYMNFVKIARITFKNDPGLWKKLELAGSRKSTYSGWIGQAKLLYTNLLTDPEALTKMAKFGTTAEALEAGLDLVNIVEEKLANQKKEMGEAQDATIERDNAVDELQDWYSDFKEIARIALAEHPQYLEMIGISEPS